MSLTNYCFYSNNVITVVLMKDKYFLFGSIFTEYSLSSEISPFSHWIFNEESISPEDSNKCNEDKLIEVLSKIDYIIISSFDDIVSWPYIINKYGTISEEGIMFNKKKVLFYTTEVVSQLGNFYLKSIYKIFNNSLKVKYGLFCVSDENINYFIQSINKLNYSQVNKINSDFSITLLPSGYSLGSSNSLVKYYNKTLLFVSKCSLLKDRYTREFCLSDNIDYHILLPDSYCSAEGNSFESYYNKISSFISKINTSCLKSDIILVLDLLDILDILDFIRLKVSKDIIFIYMNLFVKHLIEYSNVSHGYINSSLYNKIYDFNYPFNFDELLGLESIKGSNQGNRQYNSFYSYNALTSTNIQQRLYITKLVDDKAQQLILKQKNGIVFLINTFYYLFDYDAKMHIETLLNKDNNKKLIITNRKVKEPTTDRIEYYSYDFEQRPTKQELFDFLKENIIDLNNSNQTTAFIKDFNDNVLFENCIIKVDKMNKLDSDCNIFVLKEERNQIEININSFSSEIVNPNINEIDEFEKCLELLLKYNNMNMELMNKGNHICININNKTTGCDSEVILKFSSDVKNEINDVEVITSSEDDYVFLSTCVNSLLVN